MKMKARTATMGVALSAGLGLVGGASGGGWSAL
jgi:hypothetical protein